MPKTFTKKAYSVSRHFLIFSFFVNPWPSPVNARKEGQSQEGWLINPSLTYLIPGQKSPTHLRITHRHLEVPWLSPLQTFFLIAMAEQSAEDERLIPSHSDDEKSAQRGVKKQKWKLIKLFFGLSWIYCRESTNSFFLTKSSVPWKKITGHLIFSLLWMGDRSS